MRRIVLNLMMTLEAESQGRFYNAFKGKYSSRSSDPWMESRYRVNQCFVSWLKSDRDRQGWNMLLADIKAEIRNDYVRAGDLWEEYQISLGVESNSSSSILRPSLVSPEAIIDTASANKNRARDF